MRITELEAGGGHELLLECAEESAGYRGLIAVHSTRLGPAVGGTRFWNYASVEEAITDALRLSRGMLLNVFRIARAESVPPNVAADRLAEERLNKEEIGIRG